MDTHDECGVDIEDEGLIGREISRHFNDSEVIAVDKRRVRKHVREPWNDDCVVADLRMDGTGEATALHQTP